MRDQYNAYVRRFQQPIQERVDQVTIVGLQAELLDGGFGLIVDQAADVESDDLSLITLGWRKPIGLICRQIAGHDRRKGEGHVHTATVSERIELVSQQFLQCNESIRVAGPGHGGPPDNPRCSLPGLFGMEWTVCLRQQYQWTPSFERDQFRQHNRLKARLSVEVCETVTRADIQYGIGLSDCLGRRIESATSPRGDPDIPQTRCPVVASRMNGTAALNWNLSVPEVDCVVAEPDSVIKHGEPLNIPGIQVPQN